MSVMRRISLLPPAIFICGLGWFVSASAQDQVQHPQCPQYDSQGSCVALTTPLATILAAPEKFHEKTVQTVGYLRFHFEQYDLAVHERPRYRESIWVFTRGEPIRTEADAERWYLHDRLLECKFDRQWVTVLGTFDNRPNGHMAPTYPASIVVDHIELLRGREKPCKKWTAALQKAQH